MSQAPIDKSTIDQVNRLLAQTGERERLKDMLRSKLVECGWTDRVQTECFSITKKYLLSSKTVSVSSV